MLGLAILFIFGVYLAISIFATWYVMAWARESGRRAWLWGCIAGFAMYNLVFWDLIPTLVMHKYYCSTQAGFWPYKTFEQWDAENPGIAETFSTRIDPTDAEKKAIPLPENTRRHWYNVRFYKDTHTSDKVGSLVMFENQLFDVETKEIIARSVNFFRGLPGDTLALGGSPEEIRQSLVLGWGNRHCEVGGEPVQDTFAAYIYNFWKSGKGK
jgi:hypothetical protein